MGWIIDLSERSGDVRRFEEGLKMAKHGLSEAVEIWEDMKSQFSERNYSERYGHHYDRRYPMQDDWQERRDRMGRYM